MYSSLDEIAEGFLNENIDVVSFDLFDTLVTRPLESSTDVFEMLDRDFGRLHGASVSFKKLRMDAEATLRRRIIRGEIEKEDIRLSDIYKALISDFGIDESLAYKLMDEEVSLEISLSRPRESGMFLWDKAMDSGKAVIVTSDMYLEKSCLMEILKENGYDGYQDIYVSSEIGKRKISGNLYKAVSEILGVAPERIFHIGDNEESDYNIPIQLGFKAAYLPSTMKMYDSRGCSHQVEKICADLTDWEAAKRSVGIGAMRQMAANKYFDDPFRTFDDNSDYNSDPYFVGYGALGMHLLALTKWLSENAERDSIKHLIFMARDGYLPKKAYDIYRKMHPSLPESMYLHVSRRSVLPAMIKEPEDLYDLPVDITYQTPKKLLSLLEFCDGKACVDTNVNQITETGDNHFTPDSFREFIHGFIIERYDRNKHNAAKQRIADYIRNKTRDSLKDCAALFDMGYSGRIPAAVMDVTETDPAVYYFHADGRNHFRFEKRSGMKIRSFFDFNPYMEASLREYSYLEATASCIGYTDDLEEIYDAGPADGYYKAALQMQKGAMDFVKDYQDFFRDYENEVSFRYHDAAMPFEAFIRYCRGSDLGIYDKVLIDDELWGGRRDIDLKYLIEARRSKIPEYALNSEELDERKSQASNKTKSESETIGHLKNECEKIKPNESGCEKGECPENSVRDNANKSVLYDVSEQDDCPEWDSEINTSQMRESALNWYEFKADSSALLIGSEDDVLMGLLSRKCGSADCTESKTSMDAEVGSEAKISAEIEVGSGAKISAETEVGSESEISADTYYISDDSTAPKKYDYIVCMDGKKLADGGAAIIKVWRRLLNPGGVIILGVDNRYALREFCGNGEGMDSRDDSMNRLGRFSKLELEEMIKSAGISNYKFYYPVPDMRMPQMIFTDSYMNGINTRERLNDYNYHDHPMRVMEHRLFGDVIDSGALPFMSDSYIIEICPDAAAIAAMAESVDEVCGDSADVLNDRQSDGASGRLTDVLNNRQSGEVREKSTVRQNSKLSDIDYAVITTDRGSMLGMATTIRHDGRVIKRALYSEGEAQLRKLNAYTEKLKSCGVPVVETKLCSDETGMYLEMPYISYEGMSGVLERMVNSDRKRFLEIFDAIFMYIKRSTGGDDASDCKINDGDDTVFLDLAPCNAFYVPGQEKAEDSILFYDQEFISDDATPEYAMYRTIRYFFESSASARAAMDVSEMFRRYNISEDDEKLFAEKEKRFIESVRNTDQFDWVIRASRPNLIKDKVSVKNGPDEIAKPDGIRLSKAGEIKSSKPYHIGYVPGVFDLFHKGHLRLIERCKERCDILIVGVLTDELVEYYKGKRPIISCEDRMEVIKGLRAVDRVIPVDFSNTDKIDAWEQLHYDCHFSGDDHVGHWNDILAELRKRGSNMEFFSYTKGISSTEIRNGIHSGTTEKN